MSFDLTPDDVFDGQAHIWADATPERPWRPEWFSRAHRIPALGGKELLAMMDDAGVGRAVLVPPSWAGDDNDVVIEAAEEHPGRFVVMARVPVDRASGEPMLKEFAEHPAIFGVRLTFHRPEMRAWLTDGTTDWLWPALAAHGLAAMVYAPGRNPELQRIARRNPGLRLAVDTLGLTLTMRDDEIDAPIRELEIFADVPNVVVKATALPGYVSDGYPFASLAPRLRFLLDTLGPDRVLWAGDLTRVPHPYRSIVTFAADLGVLSDDELTAFMGRSLANWLSPARPNTDRQVRTDR